MSGMKIHANAFPVNNEKVPALKANVSFELGEKIRVSGAQLWEGEKGLYLRMPCFKKGDGTYQDICHATTKEFREALQDTALQAYASENHFWIKNGKTNPSIKATMNEYVNEERNIYGFGTMTFGGEFAVRDLQVKEVKSGERAGGKFVAFPTNSYEKDGETHHRRIVEGKDQETQNLMQNLAMKAYKDKLVSKEQEAEVEQEAESKKPSLEEQVKGAEHKKAAKPSKENETKKEKEEELSH